MKMSSDYFVVLDDATQHRCRYYQTLLGVNAITATNVGDIDVLLKQGWDKAWHVVVWMPYDFGAELMLGGDTAAMYLLWFEHCAVLADDDERLPWHVSQAHPCGIVGLHNTVAQADYMQCIDVIHAAISRGDVYQINYTSRWQAQLYGEPSVLYARLRQRQAVPYGVLAHVPAAINAGAAWHLGFSPELFLEIEPHGLVRTKPMKGTAPIIQDGHDAQRAESLRHDAKNRAENVMIVDLLRNDLGKIAQTGGVTVPQAFEVTAFGSVWQMTSTVEAIMRPETSVADIIRAAFPCGSITGAPKRMAMTLIAALETRTRGLYTGSIGFLEPCDSGLGFHGCWNVVIRSLALTEQTPRQYQMALDIGSGIVIDSEREAEWQECGWKAQFVRTLPAEVGLIETLQVVAGECALLPQHQQRLLNSVRDLQIPCSIDALWQDVQDACLNHCSEGRWRMKIALAADGRWQLSHSPLAASPDTVDVCVATTTLADADVLRCYKTTHRQPFDVAWQQAEARGCFDGLLFNHAGYLLEGGRSNVFIEYQGQWLTPALSLDVLNGVMRQAILQRPEYYGFAGGVQEHPAITLNMVQQASRIRLSNAVRGVMGARLLLT